MKELPDRFSGCGYRVFWIQIRLTSVVGKDQNKPKLPWISTCGSNQLLTTYINPTKHFIVWCSLEQLQELCLHLLWVPAALVTGLAAVHGEFHVLWMLQRSQNSYTDGHMLMTSQKFRNIDFESKGRYKTYVFLEEVLQRDADWHDVGPLQARWIPYVRNFVRTLKINEIILTKEDSYSYKNEKRIYTASTISFLTPNKTYTLQSLDYNIP